MRGKLSLLAGIVAVFLLALAATLSWGDHASADDPTPTPTGTFEPLPTPTGCPEYRLEATGNPPDGSLVDIGQYIDYDFAVTSPSGHELGWLRVEIENLIDVSLTPTQYVVCDLFGNTRAHCQFITPATVGVDGYASPTTSGSVVIRAAAVGKDICTNYVKTEVSFPFAPTPTAPPGVGGVVKLPAGAAAAESVALSERSGWSGGTWAALAGAATGVMAVAAGAWYARRSQQGG